MNLYYDDNPDGLVTVGMIDRAGSYEFDMFAIWRKPDGTLAWGEDSGCSCPCPFEDITLADLETGTIADAHAALDAWDSLRSEYDEDVSGEVNELHAKLAELR